MRLATNLGLAALTFALDAAPSMAAVRLCTEIVASPPMHARAEQDAKRLAISAWVARAAALGVEHPAWRIAADKILKCLAVEDGYQCIALGRACTVVQAPPGARRTGPKRDL